MNCSLSCTDVLPKMMCLCNHSNEGKQKFEFQASVKDIQTSYLTEWKNLLKSKYNLIKWKKVDAISYIHVVVLL